MHALGDATHYQISQEFYDAVLALNRRHPSAGDPQFLNKLDRYLLGTNLKAAKTISYIESHLNDMEASIKGSRFLDLGCGAGGCLAAALRAGAVYCEGWEINKDKLSLAALNTGSLPSGGRLAVIKKSMDVPLDASLSIAPFTVIVCEQVLEHVKNLPESVRMIANLLDSSCGYAYVSIPNGFSLQNVLKDPHLMLFGLSLLDRYEGSALAKAVKNHTHYKEMMGDFLHYDEYVSLFESYNLVVRPLHVAAFETATLESHRNKLDEIALLKHERLKEWNGKVCAETLALLSHRLSGYVHEATRRYQKCQEEPTGSGALNSFITDYGIDNFEFLISHPRRN